MGWRNIPDDSVSAFHFLSNAFLYLAVLFFKVETFINMEHGCANAKTDGKF
jgi:hypothetical protein